MDRDRAKRQYYLEKRSKLEKEMNKRLEKLKLPLNIDQLRALGRFLVDKVYDHKHVRENDLVILDVPGGILK